MCASPAEAASCTIRSNPAEAAYGTISSSPAEVANSCAPVGRGSPEADPRGSLGGSKGWPSPPGGGAHQPQLCREGGLHTQTPRRPPFGGRSGRNAKISFAHAARGDCTRSPPGPHTHPPTAAPWTPRGTPWDPCRGFLDRLVHMNLRTRLDWSEWCNERPRLDWNEGCKKRPRLD